MQCGTIREIKVTKVDGDVVATVEFEERVCKAAYLPLTLLKLHSRTVFHLLSQKTKREYQAKKLRLT
jgi:hypothetical protein